MTPEKQPMISVGIPCDVNSLSFNGKYRCVGRIYTPDSPDSFCLVPSVRYGIGFHWESRMDFRLPGDIEIREGGIINHLPLETYLACVIGSEMNPEAEIEFLKAHAVISRSWALGKILLKKDYDDAGRVNEPGRIISWEDSAGHKDFDVCADDHCQRYQGLVDSPKTSEAVAATRGLVLMDADGALCDARFSKCCGGRTELFSSCWQTRDYPYLASFDDPFCNPSRHAPEFRDAVLSKALKSYDASTDYFTWTEDVDAKTLQEDVEKKFNIQIGEINSIVPLRKGASGRIVELEIIGSLGSLRIGKELPIRRLLSRNTLKSSRFEIAERPGGFRLIGRGWGHGVGLCQIGAAFMATEGHTYREILAFYYPGASLKQFYP